uniref:Endoplasmic reticulum-Golgi intermediate compartment protein 3 n=1 Tax=Lutzomyia longipalpis TaxID=7200 RepID=A0A1B0C8U8_LUTLO
MSSRTHSDNALKEGCQIYGTMEVNRMGGSFHIAPGQSFSINHVHIHDVQPYTSSSFNTSHTIKHLSFGERINFANTHPLDELHVAADEGAMMFQYYIKIVPTLYIKRSGEAVHTNQFSVTRHQKVVSIITGESGMPGIFFSYELSPLMVKYTETENSIGHLATNICAIVGGIYTVAGILYSMLHTSLNAIKKKIELGKFNAYRAKRWNPVPEDFVQCQNEKMSSRTHSDNALKEGCQIYGTMEVNRMGGSFHIAPGQSFSINHVHIHDVQPYTSSSFNTSHTIKHLSFGERINFANTHPLDELHVAADEGAMMFQYYIKIVPTLYIKRSGEAVHTNQFSVTRHQKVVSIITGESGMPGIFFSYELSPLMVKYTETENSIGHLATNICAIVGGIYTVAGILYSMLHTSLNAIKKKIELGKFS